MEKTLLILEVSQKQAYIFGSNELAQNVARSAIIKRVTESDFFKEAAKEYYNEENLVYAGGGHTVLQFQDSETAVEFAKRVTGEAMKRFPGLELFVKCLEYDETRSPGENLTALSAALEKKKSLRSSAFRTVSFGLEKSAENLVDIKVSDSLDAPAGYLYPTKFEELSGDSEDNFIAVIHIDGNAMGTRVEGIYKKYENDWEACCAGLRRFSESIQSDFSAALQETATIVADSRDYANGILPIRPVILAGDDMCFITAGNLGLECARICLEHLANKINAEDGKNYAACAGVAIVHTKYPFHQAFDMAEMLCDSAKRRCAELDEKRRISAMDWHIEFGQLRDDLGSQREEYITEDGNRLELRPVTVVIPEEAGWNEDFRSYAFFRSMCRAMQRESGKIARSKVKEFRTVLHQGETESTFFLHDREIKELLENVFESKYRDAEARREKFVEMLAARSKAERPVFVVCDAKSDIKRSLFFDAIEMIDHWEELEDAQNG